jgi:ferritin-like metal-binding protein YciE
LADCFWDIPVSFRSNGAAPVWLANQGSAGRLRFVTHNTGLIPAFLLERLENPELVRSFDVAPQVSRRSTRPVFQRIRPNHEEPAMPKMKTMEDLFYGLLQDVYYAEKQLLRALPKMAKNAANPELEKALVTHRDETETQVQRLEQAFEMIDKRAKGKKCEAIIGLTEEGNEVIKEAEDDDVRDAGIVGAAQAVEHYEIARYGTLCAWAKQLGKPEIARLLHQTLEEEKKADMLLTQIAEQQVNKAAAA